jgi:intein/homing endonuclease
VLQFPTTAQVPAKYMWHFVRGYFDGDGCVYIKSGNRNIVDFVGSHDFIAGLNKFLDSEQVFGKVYKYKNKNTSNLKIMNQSSVYNFYKKCYEDSDNLFLTRKFGKFTI